MTTFDVEQHEKVNHSCSVETIEVSEMNHDVYEDAYNALRFHPGVIRNSITAMHRLTADDPQGRPIYQTEGQLRSDGSWVSVQVRVTG